ncbi:hypothetical protein MTX78_17135 [Hymenobacter tibetensis]|uniref:Glycosyltransferase RgtA/B/C/D-like domain-containing protein n=1 Tax=Hymenobacter tibetensis TaxID=497967 RepID=A0ABY4CU87_9BACT|nr:hypothetical protein [Hymenobacter tibetensis]UOG73835.1 hypothetical protein MTX78_17135 [Hymenobacter tibetensis]
MSSPSRIAGWFCTVLLVAIAWWYYPPQVGRTSPVLNWDASGYYLYLPSIFVHHDLRELNFRDQLLKDYAPTPDFYQAFRHPGSGNFVMKYPAGLAVQELPFFLAAHTLAKPLGYPADGFSQPYQVAIKLGSLLVSVLGLWLVRRALLPRFGEWPTALTLLFIVLGTNYTVYSGAGHGGMTHCWLFTWYAGVLLLTPAFYTRPTVARAVSIGAIIGLMTLTRPTEILALLIPLLWGLTNRAAVRERLVFWKAHSRLLLLAALVGAAVLSIQPLYWHYVSGDWVVYSYQEQGFSWFKPHLWDGIFSFRSGWLMYSPLLLTALVGFRPLRRQQPEAFWAMLVFTVLFTYVTFAWDEWTYGGGLGIRAMIESYAVLAWPMAAALRWLQSRPRWAAAYSVVAVLGCAYGYWLTQMAMPGGTGLLAAGEMTRTYLWRILFRYEVPPETTLLLDSNAEFTGTARNARVLWQQDFEAPAPGICGTPALQGNCSLALDSTHSRSQEWVIPARPGQFEWLRAYADVRAADKEWDLNRMTQYVIRFRRGDDILRARTVRFQRALEPGWPRTLHFDVHTPKEDFDNISITFLYYGTAANLLLDNAKLEAFDE